MTLRRETRQQLREAGITAGQWARARGFTDSRWGGDTCGCPDPCCIGFHHDDADDCGCLSALLDIEDSK
jgi:hypothetical protein